jgi:hypothetical protein
MAERLQFSSVELDKFSRNSKGVHADFSSALNSSVMQAMGWTDIPECLTGADLEGEIACISMELIPTDTLLKKHAIELDLASLHTFQTVRRELEGKKGKGYRTELRFKVTCQDQQGARKLEAYMLTAGKSTIKVSYEKQAKQEEMPLDSDLDTGCVACNSGIPLLEGGKKHESGARCTAKAVQQELTQ